jgi:uncharacterized protein involved in exopolysaccharide biosynthesis
MIRMKLNSQFPLNITPESPARKIAQQLVEFRTWWLVPTLFCTLVAVFYALVAAKTYNARQTLVVRDDLVGTFYKPGRFDSLESMKSAQETILEISRRPQVVGAALQKLGPPGSKSSGWPDEETIEQIQGKIQITEPDGAEFGKTEAIVLSVQADSRERSKDFIVLLLNEIESSLRDVRSQQFGSMAKELTEATRIASESYQVAADNLQKFESEVGPDLSTLISLNDSQAGTNNLQSELATLTVEQRTAWENVETARKQIQILEEVVHTPEDLLEVPTELLQLQPTLDSLAKVLNEELLNYSTYIGRYTPQHVRVKKALRSIEDVKRQINEKLAESLRSLKHKVDWRQQKFDQLTEQINDRRNRLARLSEIRVDYSTLLGELNEKTEVNRKAQASLAEIQSLGAAASEVDLITRVGQPQVDIYPVGPSRKMIILGGMAAGLFIGFGLVTFVATGEPRLLLDSGSTDLTAPAVNQSANRMPEAFEQREKVVPEKPPVPIPSPATTPDSAEVQYSSQDRQEPAAGKSQISEKGESFTDPVVGTLVEADINAPPTSTAGSQFESRATIEQILTREEPERENKSVPIPVVDVPDESLIEDTEMVSHDQTKLDELAEIWAVSRPAGAENDKPYTSLPEKIRQLDQQELQEQNISLEQAESTGQSAEKTRKQPIHNDIPPAVEAETDSVSTADTSTGLPLNTSNQNSSAAAAEGDESDRNSGNEPEVRPTATTVDLRMLKEQLSGRASRKKKDAENDKSIDGDAVANQDVQQSVSSAKNLVIDKHIADLANSIRNMCRPEDPQQNPGESGDPF